MVVMSNLLPVQNKKIWAKSSITTIIKRAISPKTIQNQKNKK